MYSLFHILRVTRADLCDLSSANMSTSIEDLVVRRTTAISS